MANEQSVASQVIKQLQDLGWNQAQATGIAANIQAAVSIPMIMFSRSKD